MTTETPGLALPGERATEVRILTSVSAAHFFSHFYFLLLPPVFLLARAEYGVSYTELAVALSVFNVVSAIFQTPAGILADRMGPHVVLVAGLFIEAVAFALVGAVHSYWFMVAMFGVAGLGNTVFHPCDYAILSHHTAKERVGRYFSIHTFSGMLGNAVAPATVLLLAATIGWRGAFIASGIAGLAVCAVLVLLREDFAEGPHLARKTESKEANAADWALLTSGPILRSLGFFTALSCVSVGIQNYSVVALDALFKTPLTVGNSALTANLLLSSIGVLFGGVLVGRLANHSLFAAIGIAVTGLSILLVGTVDLGTIGLIAVMCVSGFASGIIMPSRDMIVREVTPPGSFGTVFGFVTTGFNIAGVIFPVVFGALMDHGSPQMVFILSAAAALISIASVVTVKRPARSAISA